LTWEDRYPAERLVPFDPGWAQRYTVVAAGLQNVLGPRWRVEHVGSTSVPGLIAKPVIDVALRIPAGESPTKWQPAFVESGWTEIVPIGDHQATFLLDGTVRTVIGHLFTAEEWRTAHVRLFARWLRELDQDKRPLRRSQEGAGRPGTWGSDYTNQKGALVLEIVNYARSDLGLHPLVALQPAGEVSPSGQRVTP